jgi:adenylate cyclase class IV
LPTNLELKAHLASTSIAQNKALEAGAQEGGILLQTDTYFRVSNGRLKLRETSGIGAELIQYDRAEDASERWSNYRKIAISEPELLKRALTETLGVLVVVRKKRALFLYKGARIHFDQVEGLGPFIEFEVPSPGSTDPQVLMAELRAIFDVREELVEKGSYSDLLLAKGVL